MPERVTGDATVHKYRYLHTLETPWQPSRCKGVGRAPALTDAPRPQPSPAIGALRGLPASLPRLPPSHRIRVFLLLGGASPAWSPPPVIFPRVHTLPSKR